MKLVYVVMTIMAIGVVLLGIVAFTVIGDYSKAKSFCRDKGLDFANDEYGYTCYTIDDNQMNRQTISVKKGVVYYD